MNDDFLHANTTIDWAVSQIPAFEKRLRLWIEGNIELTIEHTDAHVPHDFVVAVEKSAFPLTFMVEAGAYINTIRSSLDILATTLAQRYRVPKPEDCYFPVVRSQALFESMRGYKGAELVKGLPQFERAKIESLKPYQGGNELLWQLHRLDIIRKHKRIITPAITPGTVVVGGFGRHEVDPFRPTFSEWVSVDGKTKLGTLDKPRFSDPQFKFASFIAVDDAGSLSGTPLNVILRKFARTAKHAVELFQFYPPIS